MAPSFIDSYVILNVEAVLLALVASFLILVPLYYLCFSAYKSNIENINNLDRFLEVKVLVSCKA